MVKSLVAVIEIQEVMPCKENNIFEYNTGIGDVVLATKVMDRLCSNIESLSGKKVVWNFTQN